MVGMNVQKEQIASLVRQFSDEHFTEAAISSWYRNQGMPTDVLKAFYASDLGKLSLPERLGGLQADLKTQVCIIEELHRSAGALLPILSHFLSMQIVQTFGEDRQFELIKHMLETTGSTGFSEAITEPQAGSDVFAIETVARTVGDEIFLNGTKTFVTSGQFAPHILVLARDEYVDADNAGADGDSDGGGSGDDGSFTFWLVPRTLDGISIYPLESLGQSMTPQSIIHFENVRVEPEWVLKRRGDARRAIMPCFDIGRTLLCAASLGLAEAAMDDAVRYASNRKSFGKTVTSLPQIQEKITDMEIAIRAMRAAVYDAAEKHAACEGFADHDANQAFKLSATLAKRMVPKTATYVASEAMQIMGGIGYTNMSRVGRIWNDCRGNQFAQGTDEIMVKIAARRIVDGYLNDKL